MKSPHSVKYNIFFCVLSWFNVDNEGNLICNDCSDEFDEAKELDWFLLEYPAHDAFLRYFTDLNKIYKSHKCLSRYDYDNKGFRWIDADNAKQSVFMFYREDEKEYLVCVLNMTPVAYEEFNLGVPAKGSYTEILNSEKDIYDGCNMCNFKPVKAVKNPWPGAAFDYQITIRIAPFAGIWFTCPKKAEKKAD